jgi:RHS repeat-associated protein
MYSVGEIDKDLVARESDTETGLYYYHARYYDPALGRFLSEDPIGFAGGQANLYAYVGNDPIDFTDPFGLRRLTDCEKQKLAPYIPKIDLDKADLHDGEVPWYLGKDYSGITRGNDIYFRPGVYDSSTIDGLAVLGHELVHVGQYRNGLTWLKYLIASRHGYDKNPYEKPAYDKEKEINQDMAKGKCGGCPKQ